MTQHIFNESFKRKILIVTLIAVAMSLLTVGTAEGIDLYFCVFLGFMAIYTALTVLTQYLGSSEVFLYSVVGLSTLGIAVQIILGEKGVGVLLIYNLIGCVAGVVCAFGMKFLLKCKRRRLIFILGCLNLFLYALTLVLGETSYGATAWIRLGTVTLQITDVIKLLAIVAISFILTDSEEESDLKRLLYASGIMLINAAGMMLLNELGTLLVIGVVFVCLIFIYHPSVKQPLMIVACFIAIAIIAFLICAVCAKIEDIRVGVPGIVKTLASIYNRVVFRVDLMFNLSDYDANSSGFQQNGIKNALATAKWIGCSDYEGSMAVASKDLVFLAIVYRLGIIPAIGVILLIFCMVFEGCVTIVKRRQSQPEESAVGVALMISLVTTAIMTTACNVNLFPIVGVPLPFIAKGGTAMVINMTTVILSIIFMRKEKLERCVK